MKQMMIILLALVLSSGVQARELLVNTEFATDSAEWFIWWGDSLSHSDQDGHISPAGSVQVTGHVDGFAAIAQGCIDISELAISTQFHAEGSFKPSSSATGLPFGGLVIYTYSEPDCSSEPDITQLLQEIPAGQWTRVTGDATLPPETRGIILVALANETPDGGSARFDDLSLTIGRESTEIFGNTNFSNGVDGWTEWWGTGISQDSTEGHLTANGSALVMDHTDNWTAMRRACIDVSRRAPLDQFHVAASVMPGSDAVMPESAIYVDFHSDTNCATQVGNQSFFVPATAGAWTRVDGKFAPPPGTMGIAVLVVSTGTQDGGSARFDDVSLTLTPAIRQFWLIGVGSVSEHTIHVDDMAFTRGGAFGDQFNVAAISRQGLISLTLLFDGCNSGTVSWSGNGFAGSYPVIRLAPNQAVAVCEDMGFANIGDINDWMVGYWYGFPDRDGEGFGVDVLKGGTAAVVTWYTYLPFWLGGSQ